ncbi:GSCFA domain-containing protein [Legionella sp. 27cVA30]|uniref:GSCFA domain-containing protein n=1 Tax=Legionella sp. 27cVA30 TaxID=2905657 RepID=UPI00209ED28B|nr:GSCFA domain-containing protein [Legionella sp. 27cVA30]MCP0913855.1 GSCFA domain-containing protein [Legionella sp. 27cVA30]
MNPYQDLDETKFWRTGVVDSLATGEIFKIWQPKFPVSKDSTFLTVGSCFAQHISRWLIKNGYVWLDSEPGPQDVSPEELKNNGYGVFSFRTGNIYTVSLLKQWLAQATNSMPIITEYYHENGVYYDPFRPLIPTHGFSSKEELQEARIQTFVNMIGAIAKADVFIFTLGLTEAWVSTAGAVYPVCPGTIKGVFDKQKHIFVNYSYMEVLEDLLWVIDTLNNINPHLNFLLTVSPVPLTATASNQHVLAATMYSKSVLRSVAGYLSNCKNNVDYFPSYELIASFPLRGKYFDSNLRTVTQEGVDFVMRHFEKGITPSHERKFADRLEELVDQQDVICEDVLLEAWQRKDIKCVNSKICLLGDSHMEKLSRSFDKLKIEHIGGMVMAGKRWASNEIELDDDKVFAPMVISPVWEEIIPFLKTISGNEEKIVITNIGMQSHKNVLAFRKFLDKKNVQHLTPSQFEAWYKSKNLKNIEVIRRLREKCKFKVIVLTDPPTQAINEALSGILNFWELYDEMTESLFTSMGCQVLNARKYIFSIGFDNSYYAVNAEVQDWIHGSEQYYDAIAEKLFRMINAKSPVNQNDSLCGTE